jgi:phosphoglycolate phosphatase
MRPADPNQVGPDQEKLLVIFDLDGTLLYTLEDIAASLNRVLIQRGLPGHPLDSYRQFVGSGISVLVRRVLTASGAVVADLHAGVLTDFLTDYNDHLLDNTHPYPGIMEMLEQLAASGTGLAIASNKPHGATVPLVRHFFPGLNWLQVEGHQVMGEGEKYPRKPDPTVALAIATGAGISPARTLFVGDSDIDMETGRRAGMRPVGVTWGFRDREELIGAGAEAVIDHPADLMPTMRDLLEVT